VLTEETVAEKLTLVVPEATVTEAGTVTAELLLIKPTLRPPLAAAAFSVTVQASVPAPVIEEFEQVSELTTGTPVPLRLIEVEVPDEELLERMSEPVTEPAVVGLNSTVSVVVCPAFKVSGKVAPEIEKPAPVSVAALTVTTPVPFELRVNDCDVEVFTDMLPKLKLVELTFSVGTAAPSCRAKV
jgi:hypothetical protein